MTILEHLQQELPPDIAAKAVANCEAERGDDFEFVGDDQAEDTIADTLFAAFVWKESPEGLGYWYNIFDELRAKAGH